MISEFIIAVVLLLNYGYVESDGINPLTIAGGRNTSIKTHNFMASITIRKADEFPLYRCAGSIITEDYVITTAHCVDDIGFEPIRMLVGSSDPLCGDVHRVDIIPHKHYDPETQTNDISLLSIQHSLTYNNKSIGGINLPTVEGMNFTQRTALKVIGFDLDEENLKEADLWMVNDSLCESAYGITFVSQICAKNENITLGVGDEGSPVVYNNELIGMVSRTADNINQKGLTVLVKVADYLGFIRKKVKKLRPVKN